MQYQVGLTLVVEKILVDVANIFFLPFVAEKASPHAIVISVVFHVLPESQWAILICARCSYLAPAIFRYPHEWGASFFIGGGVYPARWTGLVWRCTVGALETSILQILKFCEQFRAIRLWKQFFSEFQRRRIGICRKI